MKYAFANLIFLFLMLVSCTTNKYEKYFDNPTDWVVYYSKFSINGEAIVQNTPVAVMTLNESDLSYSFHDIDLDIFQGGAYMPFNEDTNGLYSYNIEQNDLKELSSIQCRNLRNLDEDTIIGTLTLKRDKPLEGELSGSEVYGMQYHIRVKHLESGEVELHLIPFMPGMIQFVQWDIRKRFC